MIRLIAIPMIILAGCDFYSAPEVHEKYLSEKAKAEKVRKQLDFATGHWTSSFAISSELGTEVWGDEYFSVRRFLPPEEQLGNSNIPWLTVHKSIHQKIDAVVDKDRLSEEERLYSTSIQERILMLMDKHLNQVEPSDRLARAIEKNMDILVRHRAIGIRVMAEGLVNVEALIPFEKYEGYKEYIIGVAERDQQNSINNVEGAVQAFNESSPADPNKRNHLYMRMKLLEQWSHEADYVLKLLDEH